MTKVYYAERPAPVEIKVGVDRQYILVRENITEEGEGFSCNEFVGKTMVGVEATDQLVENIKTADREKTAKEVRVKRDELLAESDFHMISDVPGDHDAWATYRTALRNIPEQTGFPYNVVFPEKP